MPDTDIRLLCVNTRCPLRPRCGRSRPRDGTHRLTLFAFRQDADGRPECWSFEPLMRVVDAGRVA